MTGGKTTIGGFATTGGAITTGGGGVTTGGGATAIGGTTGATTGGGAIGGAMAIGAIGLVITGGATATGGAINTGANGLGATIPGMVVMVGFGVTTGRGAKAAGAGAIMILGLVVGEIVATGFTGGVTDGLSGAGGTLPTGVTGLGCTLGGLIPPCGAFRSVAVSALRFLTILPASPIASSAQTPDTNPRLNPIVINNEVILMAHLQS